MADALYMADYSGKISVYYLTLSAYKKLVKGICNQPSPQGMVCSLTVASWWVSSKQELFCPDNRSEQPQKHCKCKEADL